MIEIVITLDFVPEDDIASHVSICRGMKQVDFLTWIRVSHFLRVVFSSIAYLRPFVVSFSLLAMI